MSRDEAEAREDAAQDALRDEVDALMVAVVNLKVAAILCPESANRIGHHLALVHRHLGRTTAKAQELHPIADLSLGVMRLLAEDRGEV